MFICLILRITGTPLTTCKGEPYLNPQRINYFVETAMHRAISTFKAEGMPWQHIKLSINLTRPLWAQSGITGYTHVMVIWPQWVANSGAVTPQEDLSAVLVEF